MPLRFTTEMLTGIDAWAERRSVSRTEAIRAIINERLKLESEPEPPPIDVPTPLVPVDIAPVPGSEVLRSFLADPATLILTPVVLALIGVGHTGLLKLADGLNASGIPAPQGGAWHPKSVARVLAKIGITAQGEAQPISNEDPGEPETT
jgi:hypothetical protein